MQRDTTAAAKKKTATSTSTDTTPASSIKPKVTLATPKLTALAKTANAEHSAVGKSGGAMLEHARKSGAALNAAKDSMKHGEWTTWLRKNFDGSARTAQVYMSLAANPQSTADLPEASIQEAVNALRALRPKPKDKTPEDEVGVEPFADEMPSLSPARRKLLDAANKLAELVGDKEALAMVVDCIERVETPVAAA